MNIGIVAVGKLKERFWADAAAEYLKRLGAYGSVNIVEIADVSADRLGVEGALTKEGAAVLRVIPERGPVILLDREGHGVSSEDLASMLEDYGTYESSAVTFIIGGSHGVSQEVAARADKRISFGKITLPHNLARVVLLEQIYRAFRIMRGEPYHK